MRKKMKVLVLSGLLLTATGLSVQASEALSEARTTLEKWVDTRQVIAAERSEWAGQKEMLEDAIELLETEIGLLEEQIDQAEETATLADQERERLVEEREELQAASEVVATLISGFEQQVRELSKFFPPVLQEKVDPLFRRIPEQGKRTRMSLGERMQNVVGILSQVEIFNNNVTLGSELREVDGVTIEVKTLYMGLGQAFYVDATGQYAGVGRPASGEWEWTSEPGLAEEVATAIAVYENTRPAEFVPLPVEIR